MQMVKSCYRGLKREDISSEETKTVVMVHLVEEFGSRRKGDNVKRKIFKICFCSLKLQVFAHDDVE